MTGTEVLTGRVADRNGPWVADRLLELGVDLAHITICGDRPADIDAQLRFLRAEGVDDCKKEHHREAAFAKVEIRADGVALVFQYTIIYLSMLVARLPLFPLPVVLMVQ